ncbi:HdeD family acid-resistance protein [Ralstonia soli]|uniref:HdeD family acid-resistance protein n=1 Tax=Ralstonia soli TaxID=2953896 RepID=A0ABT1APC6_9RALS|nr:HdeD family acid-resistance protein [Ralstonia soli]MCO5400245.1 HdeD family acid-resistance protein [Ralstonia soli]
MLHTLSKLWWVLALRGLCALAIGVGAFVAPAVTLAVLVLVFGAYALVEGCLLLMTSFASQTPKRDRWPVLLQGLLGVAVGVLTLFNPAVTALGLLLYIAAWLLAQGVLQIVVAVRLREELAGEWWLILGGIASVLLAGYLLWRPEAGVLAVVWWIGAWAIVWGMALILAALRVRKWGRSGTARAFA